MLDIDLLMQKKTLQEIRKIADKHPGQPGQAGVPPRAAPHQESGHPREAPGALLPAHQPAPRREAGGQDAQDDARAQRSLVRVLQRQPDPLRQQPLLC